LIKASRFTDFMQRIILWLSEKIDSHPQEVPHSLILSGSDGIKLPHGIHANQYYKWSKDFMEAGKKQLNLNTIRTYSQR
jgi:hypothetical protein